MAKIMDTIKKFFLFISLIKLEGKITFFYDEKNARIG